MCDVSFDMGEMLFFSFQWLMTILIWFLICFVRVWIRNKPCWYVSWKRNCASGLCRITIRVTRCGSRWKPCTPRTITCPEKWPFYARPSKYVYARMHKQCWQARPRIYLWQSRILWISIFILANLIHFMFVLCLSFSFSLCYVCTVNNNNNNNNRSWNWGSKRRNRHSNRAMKASRNSWKCSKTRAWVS